MKLEVLHAHFMPAAFDQYDEILTSVFIDEGDAIRWLDDCFLYNGVEEPLSESERASLLNGTRLLDKSYFWRRA